MSDNKLEVIRRSVDKVTHDLGDERLYGDVWRAALVLYDLTGNPAEIDRLTSIVGQLDWLQAELDRAVAGLDALQRLIDHVRVTGNPRQRQRRHRKTTAIVAELAVPQPTR